ncbi:MAG: 3-dehydroquinate dehydratase / shikimate dehydrogenase [Acidobacteriota bacterium]|jgi:3-dehydroquinate dehydratase/shikimate dehydrogenase|nr:3-dehydroquinate dehydratase / shikimate dehydrogenase [Acidobacteriota bacterium]
MSSATVVAVLDARPTGELIATVARNAGWLEVRADLLGDLDASWLRSHFPGALLYSLRSQAEGGAAEGDASRRARLIAAARDYDFIDLELGDLVPAVLKAIPPSKRIISSRRSTPELAHLGDRLRVMTSVEAHLYRISAIAKRSGDELAPLQLLKETGRTDVTAYATGPIGLWSRIVAPWLGAPIVFGRVGDDDTAEGLPSIDRLVGSFGFPDLPEIDELFGMVGAPVMHSHSPRIHNTAFRATGRNALYVPFHVDEFSDFWSRVISNGALESLGFSINALSVVSPHKAIALGAARSKSPVVRRAGSTNFFRRGADGEWVAETTDAEGVILTLRERGIPCAKQRVAVIGCGGSGRAMAAALDQAGADVTLVNRGLERASLAVRLLRLPFMPLNSFSGDGFSIVVNATPVGRDSDEISFPIESLKRDATIVDLVYRDTPTQLMTRTRGPGRITIDGWDMLITQALEQFRLMTGDEMPEGLARQTLGLEPAELIAEC